MALTCTNVIKADEDSDIVELPPFIVEDYKLRQEYYTCELPGVRLLSLASKRETQKVATGCLDRLRLYAALIPRDLWSGYSRPTLAMLRPLSGQPEVVESRGRIVNVGTRVLSDMDTKCWYFVYRENHHPDEKTGAGIAQMHVWFPSDDALPLPQWVRLAIAGFTAPRTHGEPELSIAATSARFYVPNRIFRPPEEWRDISFDAAFPADRAVFHTYDSPFLRHFAAWALLSQDAQRVDSFWDFVRVLSKRPATEDDLKKCFGVSFGVLKARIAHDWNKLKPEPRRDRETNLVIKPTEYLGGRSVNVRLAPPKAGADPVVRQPGDRERLLIASEWERLESESLIREAATRGQTPPKRALDLLSGSIKRLQRQVGTARDPEFVALLGLALLDRGDVDQSIPLLEESVRGKVSRSRIYWELAKHRFDMARKSSGGGAASQLDDAKAAEILDLLAMCRRMAPPSKQVYELCLEVLEASSDAVVKKQAALHTEACERLPRHRAEFLGSGVSRRLSAFRE